MKSTACNKCGRELVPGPKAERSHTARGFTCSVSGIPALVCPGGCEGSYWYWADFGVELMDLLSPDSSNVADRSSAFFKARDMCKTCKTELVDAQASREFLFHGTLNNGEMITMIVTGPARSCPRCGSFFMPAQRSRHDRYYIDLSSTIGETITAGFVYQ